ncbi:unnamed protein product [Prorocentrum cordatum]|uniref:Uncharacterized protein n=1 Tax=Prorocentrum cordatum TaxID=2364126 RepID=A0ABN9X558_9DINO|nr:unnamed protein product [Polarella glacialis]
MLALKAVPSLWQQALLMGSEGANSQRGNFRKRWARDKFNRVIDVKEKEGSPTYLGKSKGNMTSIEDMLKKEGPEDTAKRVTKCTASGGPWIEWGDARGGKGAPAIGAGGAGEPLDGEIEPEPERGAAPKAKGKAAAGMRGAAEAREQPNVAKKQSSPMVPANMAVIKSTTEWEWAIDEHSHNDLICAIAALERAVACDPFTQTFLSIDVGELKQEYNEGQIAAQRGSVSQMLDALVKKVAVETQSLVNGHAVRMKAVTAA